MYSKRKVILFVAAAMKKGGMERQLSLLFEKYSNEEFEIHIALFRISIEYPIAPNVIIHKLDKKSKVDILFIGKLASLIIRLKPLVIFSTISGVNNYCQIIGTLLSIPVICSIRNCGKEVDYHVMIIINRLFPYKTIICNSHYAKEELHSYIPHIPDSRIKVIPNGVDIDKFRPRISDSLQFGNKELQFTTKYKFIFVARISPAKNHIYLMQAFEELNQYNSVLVFIGTITDKKYYQECLKVYSTLVMKNNIYWEEGKDNIEEYYNWADCFVLPSLFEGCSNVLLEAMACELPVVVSEEADRDKIIVSEINGLRFSLENHNEMVECLKRIYVENRRKSGLFGKNNRKKIIENYSVSSLVSANDEIIRSVINETRR